MPQEIHTMNDEKRRQILRMRAETLAREPVKSGLEGEQIEIVEFLLAEERYAIESSYVSEVYPLKDLTPLPGTPQFVLGLVNLRGKILSIIDLRKFFDLPVKGLSDLNKVIVLQNKEMEFGLLADAVLDARTIALNTLLAPLPTLTEIRAVYLRGVTEQRLVVLDGNKLLCDRNMLVQDEV